MPKLGTIKNSRLQGYRRKGLKPPSLHSSPLYDPDPAKSITTGVTTLTSAMLDPIQLVE